MPSCDGSNCGACACNCDYSLKREVEDLKEQNQELLAELMKLKVQIEIEKANPVSKTD